MKHRKDISRLLTPSFVARDLVKFVSKESLENKNKKTVESITRETK